MAQIDHIIIKVNDLSQSTEFFIEIMGFVDAGTDGPFQVIRVSDVFQLQLAPWGTQGFEHYAFAVSRTEFDSIYQRVKEAGIEYGSSFHNVGDNDGVGEEVGAQGAAPTLYFYDPNKHLVEIRSYEALSVLNEIGEG